MDERNWTCVACHGVSQDACPKVLLVAGKVFRFCEQCQAGVEVREPQPVSELPPEPEMVTEAGVGL